MPRYNARRGGHAPGHLRRQFADAIESGQTPTKFIIGQLWNCSDIMPRDLCDELDMARGSTYAQGVRGIAKRKKRSKKASRREHRRQMEELTDRQTKHRLATRTSAKEPVSRATLPRRRNARRCGEVSGMNNMTEFLMTPDGKLIGLLTEKEASAFLSRSPSTLRNWRHQGCGPPYVLVGRRVGYRIEDLQAYTEERLVETR